MKLSKSYSKLKKWIGSASTDDDGQTTDDVMGRRSDLKEEIAAFERMRSASKTYKTND